MQQLLAPIPHLWPCARPVLTRIREEGTEGVNDPGHIHAQYLANRGGGCVTYVSAAAFSVGEWRAFSIATNVSRYVCI